MDRSTPLPELLSDLTARARAAGLSDARWAERAGVRKETLSRLRRRGNCDLATLLQLAATVGARLAVQDAESADMPPGVDREFEARLLRLAASGDIDAATWHRQGPAFFMAGLAVLLAARPGADRPRLLALAEQLHPGASRPEVFSRWLRESPLRPSRFLAMLDQEQRRAA